MQTAHWKNLRPSALSSILTGLFLIAAPAALAHETWLLPGDFCPGAGESTSLAMTSGMSFPRLQAGIDPGRIVEAVLLQDGERSSLVPAGMREEALELNAVLQPGDACAWVWLAPRVLEIDEDGVAHYLEEIGASDATWAAWEAQAQPRRWRESYRKLARSYLHADAASAPVLTAPGADAAQPCWQQASDARFDILPLTDPNNLATGDSLRLKVLFDGQALAGQSVGLMHDGGKAPLQRSDENGEVVFILSDAGSTMIHATHLRPEAGEDFNWESDFVTLTLNVKSPSSRDR